MITGVLNPGGTLTMTSDAQWDPSGTSTGSMWQRSPSLPPLDTWTDTGDIDNSYLVLVTDLTYYFRLRKRSPNGLLTTYSNTIGPIMPITTTSTSTTTTTTAGPTTSTTTLPGSTTSTTTSEFAFSRRKGGGGGGTGLLYSTVGGAGASGFGMGGSAGVGTAGANGLSSSVHLGGNGGLFGGGSGGANTGPGSTTNYAGPAAQGAVRIITAGTVQSPVVFTDFTVPGLQSWFAPTGVSSVSVICIGGGGKGWGGGGGGGGLGWKNNITVVPGSSYAVQVGAAGNNSGTVVTDGGDSFFIDVSIVKGGGGMSVLAGINSGAPGGTFTGQGGGNGGNGSNSDGWGGGGGGAGGYTGPGGNGGDSANNYAGYPGTGGGAGGGGGHSSVDSLP